MTATDYLALAPFIAVTITALGVMLIMSFWRNHRLIASATAAGLILSFLALFPALAVYPRAVTPLLLLDGTGAFFNGLFILIALATVGISHPYLARSREQLEEYYFLVVTATLGAMTLANAEHFATVLLGLEIMSISLYTLIAYPDEGHPPLEAGLKYLVLSGVASTILFFGLALIYNAAGTLTIADLQPVLAGASSARENVWLTAGYGMFFIGMAFKLSLVPFHMWTPDVYQGAPLPITGFLATLSKAAVFALLLRLSRSSGVFDSAELSGIVAVIAVLSMILGNVLALLQKNIKRLLAYSSIAHLGYLLIGLLAISALDGDILAVEACLMFLTAYVIMTLTAFSALTMLSSVKHKGEVVQVEDLTGLFWHRPLLAFALTIAFLSLAGIPLTAGFIAKFYLFAAGVEGALWGLLWTMIVGSAIAIYYYLRVVFQMTQMAQLPDGQVSAALPVLGTALTLVLGLGVILLGTIPSAVIETVRALIMRYG